MEQPVVASSLRTRRLAKLSLVGTFFGQTFLVVFAVSAVAWSADALPAWWFGVLVPIYLVFFFAHQAARFATALSAMRDGAEAGVENSAADYLQLFSFNAIWPLAVIALAGEWLDGPDWITPACLAAGGGCLLASLAFGLIQRRTEARAGE